MAAFDASSIAPLGTLLGGGGPNLENAFEEGRYRSAQTEQAIQGAAVAQQAAIKQKQTNDSITAFKASNPDFAHLNNDQLLQLVTGGLGSDYSAAQSGQETGQKINLRNTVSNPALDALTRTRAAQGLDPGLQDVRPFGEHGYINVAAGDTAPTALGNEFATPSDAKKNFDFAQTLPGAPARTAQAFTPFVRGPQLVSLGGVSATVDPFAPNAPAKPVTDAKTVADNKATIAAETTTATDSAKKDVDLKYDLPKAKDRLANSDRTADGITRQADAILANQNLWQAIGPGEIISKIPGTQGNAIRASLQSIKAGLTTNWIQNLRDNSKTGAGIGRFTNQEIPITQNQIASLDATQPIGQFLANVKEIRDTIARQKEGTHNVFRETYPGIDDKAAPAGPPASSGAAPAAIKSDADYNALASGATFIAPDGTTRTKP